MKLEWVFCSICGNKSRIRIRKDTILLNFPLYCPKCRQETLISVQNLQVTVIDSQIRQTIMKGGDGNFGL